MLRSFFKILRSYKKKDIIFFFQLCITHATFHNYHKKSRYFLIRHFFFTLNEILFEIFRRKTMIYVTFMNVFRLRQLHSLEINSMTVNA